MAFFYPKLRTLLYTIKILLNDLNYLKLKIKIDIEISDLNFQLKKIQKDIENQKIVLLKAYISYMEESK